MVVERLLKRKFPQLSIHWMRRDGRNNSAFDFELYDLDKCVGLLEVKGFGAFRTVEWTQYKRPAIRRKKRRAEKLGNPPMATIVVRFFEKTPNPEIRWSEGFPSIPYARFNPMFKELWESIGRKAELVS